MDHSPACILSFVVTGLRRGELKQVWRWKDEPEEKRSEDQDLKVLEPAKPEQAQDPAATQENGLDGSTTGFELVSDEEGIVADDKPKRKKSSRKKRG